MRVLFIYRHRDMGISIGKVFRPIEEAMRSYCNVESIYLPISNHNPINLCKNIKAAQKRIQSGNYDIVHITGSEHYLLPYIKGVKTVVTVHDIMYYSYLSGYKRWMWRHLFINSLKQADYVTYISQLSKKEVNNIVKLHNEVVIPNPVSPTFQYKASVYNSEKPRILHIGTLERKNLNRTIEALNGINCHLRIIGDVSDATISLLNRFSIDYSISSRLSDEEIEKEYEMCDIVNFPSTYEGFGMPIIEGQATGRIVVTSNISPMKEVAGVGAVLVDPFDIDSMKNGYLSILEDVDLRSAIIDNGLRNVINYQLSTITERYYNLYNSLL